MLAEIGVDSGVFRNTIATSTGAPISDGVLQVMHGDSIVAGVPLGRIGEPEDMAGIAIYLASRAGAYVTGAVIPVDGGMSTTL